MLIRATTLLGLLALAACGSSEDTTEASAPAVEPAAEAANDAAGLQRRPAPDGARTYIIEPADGATVSSPVKVLFGLSGAGVIPSGNAHDSAGHHHLLVDTVPPDFNQPIPSDDNHRHFGGGQTETEIELEPGTHTLQLLLGDERHIPHEPPILSTVITIEVR